MTNVIKVRFIQNGEPVGIEYTYYTPVPVEIGDRVDIDTAYGLSRAIVTQVDVPVAEIARFGDRARFIRGKTAPRGTKGIVITPEGGVTVQEFPEPLYQTVGAAVGGYIEVVNPHGLPDPFRMAVNEDGRRNNLPFNPVASFWYGTQTHGHPVMGTVVLLKEDLNDERETDLFALNDADVTALMAVVDAAKASRLPEEPKSPPPPAQVCTFDSGEDMAAFLDRLYGFGKKV